MKNLLYKEFRLSLHPTCYLFLAMAAMLLIPNYPYFVAFFYQTLGVFFIFLTGNATNDVPFTALLPVRKHDVVKARVVTVVLLELLQVLVAIPFLFLRGAINPAPNLAGMEANLALIGLALGMYGVFNRVFFPKFYQTGYKAGTPYLLASSALLAFVIVAEAGIQLIPALKTTLDVPLGAYLPQQLLVFFLGLLAFGLLTGSAYRSAATRFETLDL